jgi:hypothetical protein
VRGRTGAGGLPAAWALWHEALRVPRLLWYPAFTSLPGATAVPTPSVPTPLAPVGLVVGGKVAEAPGAFARPPFCSPLRPGLPHWRRSRNMPCNMPCNVPFMPHVLLLEDDPATRERLAAPPAALRVTLAGQADTVDDEAPRGSQPCRVSRPGYRP